MDIGGNNIGLGCRLSNYTARRFIFDNVECYSMEGLLQSFKFNQKTVQLEMCTRIGASANKGGQKSNWRKDQFLYWNGVSFQRQSKEYQLLLNSAYNSLFKNENFKRDILSTENEILTHSLGKKKESQTVLTEKEFCSRLTLLRDLGTCGDEYIFT
jgi:hypothetical protein